MLSFYDGKKSKNSTVEYSLFFVIFWLVDDIY